MITKELLEEYGFTKSIIKFADYYYIYPSMKADYSLSIQLEKEGKCSVNVCGVYIRTITTEDELKQMYLGVTGQELKKKEYTGKYEFRNWAGNGLKVWLEADVTEIIQAGKIEDYLKAGIIRKKKSHYKNE